MKAIDQKHYETKGTKNRNCEPINHKHTSWNIKKLYRGADKKTG